MTFLHKYRPRTHDSMAKALRAIEEDTKRSHAENPHEPVHIRGSTIAIVQQALNLMDEDTELLEETGRKGFG